MQKHYKERYLCADWNTLAKRVAQELSNTEDEYKLYLDIIINKAFIPAGNTLVAGVKPITPNCSILGTLTEENFDEMLELSKKLWSQSTGIGFDLSGLINPVARLRELSKANDNIDLGHRPKRGNMAVLDIRHPKIREFISCKNTTNELFNFNISVAVTGNDIDEELLYLIAKQAWTSGDPGLVFLDNAKNYGPDYAHELGTITTCVPCGEQFMHMFETCNLGSINLNASYLMTDGSNKIDLRKLRHTIHTAVELMDNIVDRLIFPDERMERVSLNARRIGLGVMGWADYLERNEIRYNSSDALNLARELSSFITECALEKSAQLAVERGSHKYGDTYRNISLTCIAPTGGITGLTDNKGYAIEPFFHEATKFSYREHIDMQAAWQSGIQNAVSKTINLSSTSTVEDVVNAYKYAMEMKVKGITIYRDGSKMFQPVSLNKCEKCVA